MGTRYSVPSQAELPKSQRAVFPGGEDYLLTVLEITPALKNDFNGKQQDVLVFKFSIDSFADGAPLEDVEGNTTDPDGNPLINKWIWKDIDPKRMGFMQNGTASISRQCLLSLNGISDVTERIPDGDTDELVGRQVVGTLVVKPRKDGGKGNNITAFKPVKRRRGGRGAEQTQPAVEPAPAPPAVQRGQSPEEAAFAAAVENVMDSDGEPSAEDLAAVAAFMDS